MFENQRHETSVIKRSDRIANDIKRWVIENDLSQGDKLPNEKQLCGIFQCAKGTMREALKSLEVQGLVTIRTGPLGGPTLVEVSFKRSTELLRNYLHFRDLTVAQIYDLRKVIEVELAVSVVGLLPNDIIETLAGQVSSCCTIPVIDNMANQQINLRGKELDFHDVLANYCPNPLLTFHAKFLNDLLRNFIEFRFDHIDEYQNFTHSNIEFHRQLVDAYKAKDTEAVRQIMKAHMEDCEKHTLSLNGTLSKDLMINKI